ncbi:MAG: hypothetical protein ACUZ8O_07410 [Candidatus Anammoxibacter sp.]
MSKKKQKEKKTGEEGWNVPFGPPPEEYSYRCPDCKTEILVNEAIIDAEIGMAKFNNEYYPGYMPKLGCPGCNKYTMEYVE